MTTPPTTAQLRRTAPLELPDQVWTDLKRRYTEPHRGYHSMAHIVDVAEHFHRVGQSQAWRGPREVFAALLFHDVIYDVGATDNEARSAALAVDVLANTDVDLDRVRVLIELTAHHGRLQATDVDDEAARWLDCDTAILGADAAAFAAYEAGVWFEWVPVVGALAYEQGRRRFLHKVLAQPHIYLSSMFRLSHEDNARRNLQAALASMAPEAP
jgi:predicted metal-dependent HD superfamily phosphohydrolase